MAEYTGPAYLLIEDYAKLRGVSRQTINTSTLRGGVLAGIVRRDNAGKKIINVLEANKLLPPTPREIEEYLERKPADEDESDEESRTIVKTKINFDRARSAREAVRLQSEKIELDKLQGTVIDAVKVKRDTFLLARRLRDQIMNIPDRNSAIWAAITDERQLNDAIKSELRAALAECSRIISEEGLS